LFIDLDGTLLTSNKLIPPTTQKYLETFSLLGNKIIIMTSRSYQLKGIKNNLQRFCQTYILHNGAEIIDNEKTIYQNYLSEVDVKYIYNYIKDDCLYISGITDECYYSNYDPTLYWGSVENYRIADFSAFKDILPKLTLFFPKKNAYLKNMYQLQELYNVNILDENMTIIISKKSSTKGKAIEYLAKYYNICSSDCIAIGNDYNDISAFEYCNIKIAVRNAEKKILEMASIIIDDNNRCGVEKYLREHFGDVSNAK
jgi:Cof subfamily protein (haloacid dehalogenase superfamily)